MTRTNDALLLARTVRHLRPSQPVHRLRLRGQRLLVQAAPRQAERLLTPSRREAIGWPADFVPVDARVAASPLAELLIDGRIRLLGQERRLDDWRSREPPQLWRYHLHYWDWAWSLAEHEAREPARRCFQELFEQWQRQTRFGAWDEWSPYVVALRAWSWCGQFAPLVRGSVIERAFVRTLGTHDRYLRAHLERDVGGNHLVKDLKALVGLQVFFGRPARLRRVLALLARQVRRQVLPDGGHYERAPAYHCQVLGDLLDVQGLLGADAPGWLDDAVQRMRRWLGLVLLPDGTVPLLNDGYPVPVALLEVLQPGPPAPQGLTLLPDTGLALLLRGAWFLLADVGDPCPDELPAHAHADTLGFLLYDGDQPVVGECFTSTYEAGPRRAVERGTAAHSTVQVDDADSTEVHGAFRAARRARVRVHTARDAADRSVLRASHDGYRRLPGRPEHMRTWVLDAEGLTLEDRVAGSGRHRLRSRLHVPAVSRLGVTGAPFRREPTHIATGFEHLTSAAVLVHEQHVELPWVSTVQIRSGSVA